MRILQVNSADAGGGAETISRYLHAGFRARGHDAWLAVATKRTQDAHVLRIPRFDRTTRLGRLGEAAHSLIEHTLGPVPASPRGMTADIAMRGAAIDRLRGREDFNFPGSHSLLRLPPQPPNVLHLHNLHGNYFDLRELPALSNTLPTVVTLHDAWMLSGHCAHSLDCDRWLIGCGNCPDLTLDPPIRSDATAFNWARKQAIYQQSRVFVASPSEWLVRKVERSMLGPAVLESRVIPNGIDLQRFQPGDKCLARSVLGLPQDVDILLTVGNRLQHSPFKDYRTLREAIGILAADPTRPPTILIGIGGDHATERVGDVEVRSLPFNTTAPLADYYRAADLYVHSARAEAFGLVVAEALACGTPVVATAAGAVPELVRTLPFDQTQGIHSNEDAATGTLVAAGDASALAAAINLLLRDKALRQRLGANAAQDAAQRFGIDRQVQRYLDWFGEITSSP